MTLAVVVILVIWIVFIYNNLVALRNNRENAFANIDVQLKQRYDLIPQLVETVKGYAKHERELLEKVTQARTAARSATTINGKIEADNALSSALAGLKVQVEAYPELKANQNFLQLQGEGFLFGYEAVQDFLGFGNLLVRQPARHLAHSIHGSVFKKVLQILLPPGTKGQAPGVKLHLGNINGCIHRVSSLSISK